MNDGQIVIFIAGSTALALFGAFWCAGGYFLVLRHEIALAAAFPVIIAVAVLIPIIRRARR